MYTYMDDMTLFKRPLRANVCLRGWVRDEQAEFTVVNRSLAAWEENHGAPRCDAVASQLKDSWETIGNHWKTLGKPWENDGEMMV